MGFFNSKPKKPEINQHDVAVLNLKTTRDKLSQATKKLTIVIEKEREAAKLMVQKGNKERALLILKRKKVQEKNLQDLEALLDNVLHMVDSIEFAQVQKKVFDDLKHGNEVLKNLNSQFNIEEINLLMDDTAEAIEFQKEVGEALGQQINTADEEELLEELEKLSSASQKISQPLEFPDVPEHQLPSKPQEISNVATAQSTKVAVLE